MRRASASVRSDELRLLHRAPDDVCHVEESAAVVSERFVHYLVGGIYYARHVAALPYRFECKCQAAELLHVGFEELKGLLE